MREVVIYWFWRMDTTTKVPPINIAHENVSVSVSIELLKLVDINEEDYSNEIQFEISLMWKDNRLTFHNLKLREAIL